MNTIDKKMYILFFFGILYFQTLNELLNLKIIKMVEDYNIHLSASSISVEDVQKIDK